MAENVTSVSLLERIRLGANDESWYEFVAVYKQFIECWLSKQGVQPDDAEDIRQEVLSVVLRDIGSFQHNGRTGAFRNWLRTITSNRLREHWRSRKKHRNADGVDIEQLAQKLGDATSDVSRIWNKQHDQHMLEHLLLRISKQFKPESVSAFRLVAIEQQPIEQVSEELNLTINAIRIAQSRILRALRKAGEGLLDD